MRNDRLPSAGGLAVVGPIINRHSGLKKRSKSVPRRHGIAHIDLVRTYLGLLCQGKNDVEAVEGIRDDIFFREALGIAQATERTTNCHGQPLLFAALELEGWWTSLASDSVDADALIKLYSAAVPRSSSTATHSPGANLDGRRLPEGGVPGKVRINSRPISISNACFRASSTPMPWCSLWRRSPTISCATSARTPWSARMRLIRHGRRTVRRFGRSDPGYTTLARCHARITC